MASGTVVDDVRIEIDASAEKAKGSINKLIENLKALKEAVSEVQTDKLFELCSAIKGLAGSMKNLPKASYFSQLAKGLKKLSNINANDIAKITRELNKLSESLSNIKKNGSSGVEASLTKDVNALIRSLRSLLSETESLRKRLSSLASGANRETQNGFSGLSGAARGTDSIFERLGASTISVGKRIGGLITKVVPLASKLTLTSKLMGKLKDGMNKVSGSAGSLSKKLGKVTRLLTFMLLRKAITAMLSSLGEAFKHLAQRCDEFNEKISELISAGKYFSHQVAAMARPLLDMFGPALTYIINLLSKAIGYINQFFSALTGKSFFTQAKKVAVDYAGSLAKVGSAAKKAAKEIRDATIGIDELNIISQKDDDGSGSGGSSDLEDCYEELAINQKIFDLAQKLKDFLANMFLPMKEAWDNHGQRVIDAFHYAVDSSIRLAKDMAKTWEKVWTNGSGYKLCSIILMLLASILNWIGDIAVAWDAAWEVKGYEYVKSLLDELSSVLSLIYVIGESFRGAFNNGSGQEMIEHIYQILTDIHYTVANLANGFRRAWQEAGTGSTIAYVLFDIINLVLGSIEKIISSTREWAKNLNFSPLLISIKNLLEKIKPLVKTIGDALSWAWENVLLPLGKWVLESAIPEAIDAIATAFDALNAVLESLKPAFQWTWEHMLVPLANWTGGTIVEIIDGITTVFAGIGEVFKKIANGESVKEIGKYIWEGLVSGIKSFVPWAWGKLKDAFWGIVDLVRDLFQIHSPSIVFQEIGGYLVEGLINGIIGFAAGCGETIRKWAGDVINWFTNDGGVNSTKFTTFATDIIDGFKMRVGNYYSATRDNISSWASKVKSWFTEDGGVNSKKFSTFATNIIDGFKLKVGSYYTTARDNIVTWGSKCVSWFEEKSGKSNWETVATNVVEGFKNKIGSLYTTCKETIQSWGSSIISWFKEKLDINSPSKVFEQLAGFTIEGFANGISGADETTIRTPITMFAENVISWFTNAGGINKTSWENYAGDIIDGFGTKIKDSYTAVKDSITTWASAVHNWYTDSGNGAINAETFTSYAGNIVDGFKTKIGNYYSTVGTSILSWANNVKTWFSDNGNGAVNSSTWSIYAQNTVDGFKAKIGSYYSTSSTNITAWANATKTWFTNISGSGAWYSIASDVVNGFRNGIGALYSTCKSVIQSWASSIVDWFKDKLDINSPSRVFSKLAEFVVQGFNRGIDKEGNSTTDYINSWIGKLTDIQVNLSAKFNLSEELSKYKANLDGGITQNTILRTVQETVNANGNIRATLESSGGIKEAFREAIREEMSSTLENIETNTKIQADKKETTTVYVGNREVSHAVEEQKKADGFSFTRGSLIPA